jgi:CheY-like chemotaxis protein
VIRGPQGERIVGMHDFHRGPWTTAVGDGELLTEIRLPVLPGAGSAHEKVERRAGDWAIAAVSAAVWLDGDTFADAGIGLSPSEARQLFRPYAQASADVARRYGGAGLGLTFVKRLAKAMGGDLTVESRKGKGSTFTLTVLTEAVPVGETARVRPARPQRSLTLLYAEDNPYARVVMNTILGEFGHRVDFVETGEAAVDAVAARRYDAVLMDVTLSGLDGLEATRRIRALPGEAARIPVIGISATGDAAAQARAREAGMSAYLMKPVTPAQLAETLSRLVGA